MIELNFPNPVTTAADLFDRERELADIQQTLRSSGRRPVVIIAERVMGKTSLLNVVEEELTPDETISLLHLPHAYSRDSLAAEIMQNICAEVGHNLRQTGLLNDQGQFNLVTVSEFVDVARQLLALQPHRRFVFCLDEFDSMLANCDDLAADQILTFVLHLIERTSLPLQFLFSMTQITDQILHSYASPFLNSARLIPLKPWNPDESGRFVNWLLSGHAILDETCQRIIFAAAGGHPYLTKAILASLLNSYGYQPAPIEISAEMMHLAIEASLHLPELDFTLSNISQVHISPEQMQLLSKFAAAPNNSLSREQLQHPDNIYIEAAQKLLEGGYLDVDDQQNYIPRMGVLMNWLKYKGVIVRADAVAPLKLIIDDRQERVYLGKQEILLSPKLYRALRCLTRNTGQLIKREVLVAETWPEIKRADDTTNSMIDQLIRRLREKLGDDGNQPTYLETRHGMGFILHHAIYIPVDPQ
jgi:DNA-binding response OmpR family regulator